MVNADTEAVIVMDGDKPAGLITERDILEGMLMTSKVPSETLANEVMSSPVTTVEHSDPLADMLKTMRNKQVKILVATQEGKVMGIVTERRILGALI